MWLNIPPGPPHARQEATLFAEFTDKAGGKVGVLFDPEEAAAVGRRLLDWASRADIVTAVNAVGAVLRTDVTGLPRR